MTVPKNSEVGVVLSTFDRPDDARINLEIIRTLWEPVFPGIQVAHVNTGRPGWYPERRGEDALIRIPNGPTHGASVGRSIDIGVDAFCGSLPNLRQPRYIVHLHADTWLTNPYWLRDVVHEMQRSQLRLAASTWGLDPESAPLRRDRHWAEGLLPNDGISTDFFVVDVEWVRDFGMFPLQFQDFVEKYKPLFDYSQEVVSFEAYFTGCLLRATRQEMLLFQDQANRGLISTEEIREEPSMMKDAFTSQPLRYANELVRWMHERPIDNGDQEVPSCKGIWPNIGLVNVEDVVERRAFLANAGLDLRRCPASRKLIETPNVEAHNAVDRAMPGSEPVGFNFA